MTSTSTEIAKLPKRALTKPSIPAIVFLIIIVLFLTPNTAPIYTNKADAQDLVLIFFSPLILVALFCAYHTGLAIGKISYLKWHKGLLVSFLALIIMHLICIALCVGIEIALKGYPIKMCFDTCTEIKLIDVIIPYSIFSTILFLPAYYATLRYSDWYHKIHKNYKNQTY